MKLRTKIFLIVGFGLSVLFLGISLLLSRNLTNDFLKLEHEEAQKNIERLNNTYLSSLDELSVKLVDWSQWDDMYAFVDDQNEDFVKVNLPKETFATLRINFVVIANKENKIVFEKYVNEAGEEDTFPGGFEKYFVDNSPLVKFSGNFETHSGVLFLPDKRVVVGAIRPITSSDGTALANGTVFFGYYFDSAQSKRLSDLTQTEASFFTYKKDQPDTGIEQALANLSSEKPFFVENPGNNQKISGYKMVPDALGEPALILRAETERTIFAKGQQISNLFYKIMLSVGVLFLLVVLFLIEFFVIKPLSQMVADIKKIRLDERSEILSISASGSDEFTYLRKEINKMVNNLWVEEAKRKEMEEVKTQAEKQLVEKNEELEEKIDEFQKMNNLMVGRELRMAELKKEIDELKLKLKKA
jgi:sensor domain CHASE-containing protein